MHPDPISSALTRDNRKESKRNRRRERQDINTTSRCVVWAGLKLILLPCPSFFLLSRGTKGPACVFRSTQQKWLGPNPRRAQRPVGRVGEGGRVSGRREDGVWDDHVDRAEGKPDQFEGSSDQINPGWTNQDGTVEEQAPKG